MKVNAAITVIIYCLAGTRTQTLPINSRMRYQLRHQAITRSSRYPKKSYLFYEVASDNLGKQQQYYPLVGVRIIIVVIQVLFHCENIISLKNDPVQPEGGISTIYLNSFVFFDLAVYRKPFHIVGHNLCSLEIYINRIKLLLHLQIIPE